MLPRALSLLLLAGALLPVAAAAAQETDTETGKAEDPASAGKDYQPTHQGWNGLSQLAALAAEAGCPMEARGTLEWDTLSGSDVLFVVFPETALPEDPLHAFLAAGGRLVLADDFGAGGGALRHLGIRRREDPLPMSVPTYRSAALPIARPSRPTALGRAAPELVTNHPAYFDSALPATYAFAPALPLVIEGALGPGRFIALADPSVLINNMLEIPGNRAFAAQLVRELCRPQRDRLLLLHGAFAQRGAPPAVLPGAPLGEGLGDLPGRWNQALVSLNQYIQEGLARSGSGPGLDLASACGLCLTIAALLLLLRYLPLSTVPHDASFARPQPQDAPESGLAAAVARYARRDVPWGYLFPAALLREEVLIRLSPYLHALPRYGDSEAVRVSHKEVERQVEKRVSREAGRLAGALWQEFRTIPGRTATPPEGQVSAAWISERRMHRLHRMAVALFAELDARSAAHDHPV